MRIGILALNAEGILSRISKSSLAHAQLILRRRHHGRNRKYWGPVHRRLWPDCS